MDKCRLIVSGRGTGPGNMALDEALFIARGEDSGLPSVFRIYCWENPCVTIGYFQKYADFKTSALPVTRRLTGGLAVTHKSDISYSFITAEQDWPYVYDQEKTYQVIHSGIKEGLSLLGLNPEFYVDQKASTNPSLCVKTFFPHDVHIKGRKVVGSSQRRRGKVLLQQGSIHLQDQFSFNEVAAALAKGWEKVLRTTLFTTEPEARELELAAVLFREKYSSSSWNEKF